MTIVQEPVRQARNWGIVAVSSTEGTLRSSTWTVHKYRLKGGHLSTTAQGYRPLDRKPGIQNIDGGPWVKISTRSGKERVERV